ncbi:winged helix DNA-binding domain-containing protein [Streptomyces sp. NPDC051561]|uniref:winged helix DNA-binding domain-containing protein n=1 Tax=Streptomyces sp. NPDC051561 TaxID=3365658 RepID=UPI0037BE0A32
MTARDPNTAAPSVSWGEVCARRAQRHGLAAPLPGASPVDAVRVMCGAHAQVLSAAELSVGLRLEGVTRAEVRAALWTDRTLVKTYGPRGTVHLLPTADLPMWTGALSALPSAASPFAKDVRLSPEQLDEVVAAIGAALKDAELTADELTDEVVARTGPWAGDLVMPAFQGFWPRWRQAIATAAHRGALCFGANRGRKVTYTNPARWLPGLCPDEGPRALAALVEQFLHGYGPATAHQFAQWLNAPRGWAGELFGRLAGEGRISEVLLDGAPAYLVSGDERMPAEPVRGVRLLPYFDAYVIGSHPRPLVFPGRAAERALAGGQAGPFPVLLVDGVAAGVWHQRRSGRRLAVTVEPLAPLDRAQLRELDEQVERTATILEATAELTLGTVTVGAHA